MKLTWKLSKQGKREWQQFRVFAGGLHIRSRDLLEQLLERTGKDIADDARESIRSAVGTGRIYKIRGQLHQASAPGEVPVNLTGRLAASIGYEASRQTVRVGSTTKYGEWLETGTSRFAKRPWLEPAMMRAEGSLQSRINSLTMDRKGRIQ